MDDGFRARITTCELVPQDVAGGNERARPDALVLFLFTGGASAEQARTLARHWQPIVPSAAFVGVELDEQVGRTNLAALRRAAMEAAIARSIHPSHIILCGAGEPGRFAFDLTLRDGFCGTGVIGLDIEPDTAPFCVLPTPAMVRLVHHFTADDPRAGRLHGLIQSLQQQDLDVRAMILPESTQAVPDATIRAGSTFLAELVANASRAFPKLRSKL
jgi:hypothetical protein